MYVKILPYRIPPVYAYLHHAYTLGVLLCYADTQHWFSSNYIQLMCNTEFSKEIWFDFFGGDNYGGVPWFNYHIFDKSVLNISGNDLNEFVPFCINKGYYLHLYLDEYYLPCRRVYNNTHFTHCNLLYGYDWKNKTYNVAGFNKDNTFAESTISFSQFSDSFKAENMDLSNVRSYQNFLFKKKKFIKYDFDIKKVINILDDYLLSVNCSEKPGLYYDLHSDLRFTYLNIAGHLKDQVFGLKVYDCLKNYLEFMVPKEPEIDIRPFHCLWEHKKCMLLRITYLGNYGYIKEYHSIYKVYEEIEKLALAVRNLILKYMVTNNIGCIKKAINIIDDIYKQERSAILELLEELPKQNLRSI